MRILGQSSSGRVSPPVWSYTSFAVKKCIVRVDSGSGSSIGCRVLKIPTLAALGTAFCELLSVLPVLLLFLTSSSLAIYAIGPKFHCNDSAAKSSTAASIIRPVISSQTLFSEPTLFVRSRCFLSIGILGFIPMLSLSHYTLKCRPNHLATAFRALLL